MKDLGAIDVILGMKDTKTSDGYDLFEGQCIKQVLDKFDKRSDTELKIFEVVSHLKNNCVESLQ